jgi:hypothetical protein
MEVESKNRRQSTIRGSRWYHGFEVVLRSVQLAFTWSIEDAAIINVLGPLPAASHSAAMDCHSFTYDYSSNEYIRRKRKCHVSMEVPHALVKLDTERMR